MLAFTSSFTPALCTPQTRFTCIARPSAPALAVRRRPATMVISPENLDTALKITGNNVEVTEAMNMYVREKLAKVMKKNISMLTKVDVHVSVEHNPAIPLRHKCEVVAFAGKAILRAEVRAEDMYAAIDSVEQKIGRTLRKFRERRVNRGRKGTDNAAVASLLDTDDVEDDGPEDTYNSVDVGGGVAPVSGIVRRKSFPMPKQSVEEAVLCLEYLDHEWYLFRNEKTDEISLIYKRNSGGYGLVEPMNNQ